MAAAAEYHGRSTRMLAIGGGPASGARYGVLKELELMIVLIAL